jgi:2-polyprenyl-6-hydroxyphenyl methylase/3-demethylubiquinone-9 3-methyltransferase
MHTPVSFHNQGWETTADRSQLWNDPTTEARKRKLRNNLQVLARGEPVLDYGCGRGEFTKFLASLGFRATGIDISDQAVDLNRLDFPDLEFAHVEENTPAPYEDGSFAAIWSSEVIEHVYDVHGVFADFARLLRPGGRLVLTTPYHGWLKNMLLVTFAFEHHFNVEWQHIRFWTKRSLTAVAAKHGLRPIRWDSVGRVPWIAKSFFVVFERSVG